MIFNMVSSECMWHKLIARIQNKATLVVLLGILGICTACQKEVQEVVHQKYDPELVPTISTDSIVMHISDSGRIKYKVVTPLMQMFDRAKDPHWLYPKGVYLEQYDNSFKVNATVVADSAWNYTSRHVWRLKGKVVIKNTNGSVFKSEEFFWDQNLGKIYTDKFITITAPGRNLKGYGLDATQDFSAFQIRRPVGDMLFNAKQM